MTQTTPIVEETSTPKTPSAIARFKTTLKTNRLPIIAVAASAVVGAIGGVYIYRELANPTFMDEAKELALIADGKI